MNKKAVLSVIGSHNWNTFEKWIHGQTTGIKDGEPNYYDWDVARFVSSHVTPNDELYEVHRAMSRLEQIEKEHRVSEILTYPIWNVLGAYKREHTKKLIKGKY